jgi:ADP-ribose pyrophosphatase YjhB (NUDIX family)/thiamine kinase-like enzyme
MKESFEVTKQATSQNTYPGYPDKRLVIQNLDTLEHMTLPDGEWSTDDHELPSLDKQQWLQEQGYTLDDLGRPLHPWLNDMLTNPEVGVVTGRGFYWEWGPNRTGDPIVINTDEIPKILLIQRADTGAWALPGGFVDNDESGTDTARRELFEETGLMITGEPHEIYSGVVADIRTTAHAWAETTAVLWRVHGTPAVKANDDASNVNWFPIDELPDNLHGSHNALIEQAIVRIDSARPAHALSSPESAKSYTEISGGHMTYHRFIVKTNDNNVFIKSHDKHAFTDPVREAHSKQYLHKEKRIYDHVSNHGFVTIPQSVDIVNDHKLVMEALTSEQDWHWRVPNEHLDRYTDEAIASILNLQIIPLPNDFHDTILPTYETHIKEGWQSIDDLIIEKIKNKIDEQQPRLRSDFQKIAKQLSKNLDTLRRNFDDMTDPDTFYFTHHDLRQANLAWHPQLGVKIIDWSWAGVGRRHSDTTTLLIDLNKSGHDISNYLDYFNPDHALTLIGFWLAHSLWPTKSDDDSVRFHQIVSAISAYDLLTKYRQR